MNSLPKSEKKTRNSIDTSITAKSIEKSIKYPNCIKTPSTLYSQIPSSTVTSFHKATNLNYTTSNPYRKSMRKVSYFLTSTTPLNTEPNQIETDFDSPCKTKTRHRQSKPKPNPNHKHNQSIIKMLLDTLKSHEPKTPYALHQEQTAPNKATKSLSKNPQMLKRKLPIITESTAMNKFLIREYKPVTETPEYIQSTRNKMYIAEKFFKIKQKEQRNKTKSHNDAFESVKARNFYNDDCYTYGTIDPEEITRRKYRLMTSEDLETMSQKTKEINEERIKTDGRNMANRLLEMEPNENLQGEFCRKGNFEVSRRNLDNTITLRRIMKSKGKYNAEDESYGIRNVNMLRHERKETEYEMIKTMHCFKGPNFLKTKFGKETMRQYKGVNGKFFGVIC